MERRAVLLCLAIFASIFLASSAKIYFKEEFNDDDWEKRWVKSTAKEKDGTQGKWGITAGKWYGDAKKDKGIQTAEDARFYGITSAFEEVFSNEDKELALQFSAKHEQSIDCGGGYIKILPEGIDQEKFDGDVTYRIMFGPDICGYSTKKTHVIFNYKGQNLLIKKEVKCETDQLTHLYTLALYPNNTYEVYIDLKKEASGSLYDDWDFLPPKTIKDPEAKKPADWADEPKIADPEDKKPEGWDDEPAQIVDPEAKKPEDWDDEDDGAWEPPMIDNPKYKGEWKPKMIDNPAYKGPWVHPEIPNPEYVDDPNIYKFTDMKFVGFDLWQVKAGTIFDNIIVTDSVQEALDYGKKTWKKSAEKEKKMFEAEEEKRKALEEEQRKQAEEAAKKTEGSKEDAVPEEPEDDEDDDDEKVPTKAEKKPEVEKAKDLKDEL